MLNPTLEADAKQATLDLMDVHLLTGKTTTITQLKIVDLTPESVTIEFVRQGSLSRQFFTKAENPTYYAGLVKFAESVSALLDWFGG